MTEVNTRSDLPRYIPEGTHASAAYPQPGYPYVPPPPKMNGFAIASLVLGLVPVVPFAGSILAIIFGVVAQNNIKQSQGRERGKAMAVWGVVLGILGIVGTILFMALIVAAAHNAATYQPSQ